MLKPRALTQVLAQANSDDVVSTLLLNKDGALLAYAGFDSKDARVTSAIASNIWGTYSKSAASGGDILELVCLECEDGNVVITRVANFILCTYGKRHVGLGMLKAKDVWIGDIWLLPGACVFGEQNIFAMALVDYLQEPLQQVMNSD